jgi:hypothetical protein
MKAVPIGTIVKRRRLDPVTPQLELAAKLGDRTMKKLLAMAAIAACFVFGNVGTGGDAQAKPHGWHKGGGHHAMYRHGPRRHYGWDRGRHRGWYKHHRRHHAYYGRPRW